MTKIVKNISGQELSIPGIGVVQPGENATVPADFHSANFSEVGAEGASKAAPDGDETDDQPSAPRKARGVSK